MSRPGKPVSGNPLPAEAIGTIVVRSVPSRSHDCLGEAVVLRLIGEETGQVLSSGRCGEKPADGCDGVSMFQPGDLVSLPSGWQSRPESPLRTEELRPLRRDSHR